MGQQQLLLLILSTILVGIATMFAINMFSASSAQANRDSVHQDLLQGASSAQVIWSRPRLLNGAQQDFESLSNEALLSALNIPMAIDGETGFNQNGTYVIAEKSRSSLTLQATPVSGGEDIEMVVSRTEQNDWAVNMSEIKGNERPNPKFARFFFVY